MRNLHLLFSLLLVQLFVSAQNTTIDRTKKNEALLNRDVILQKNKVLIIPFKPTMYLSEIDKKVHDETKLNFDQIVNTFRNGLDEMIYLELKPKIKSYSLITDSAKNIKDLDYTYQSISYTYTPVPPENATKKDLNELKTQSSKPQIVNGELKVEMNTGKKFMNVKILNKELLPHLSKKYNASVFLFINEIDMKNKLEEANTIDGTYNREVTVHYSIVDASGIFLNYGTSAISFPSNINNPQKIINEYYSAIAKDIALKLVDGVAPDLSAKPAEKNKAKYK